MTDNKNVHEIKLNEGESSLWVNEPARTMNCKPEAVS